MERLKEKKKRPPTAGGASPGRTGSRGGTAGNGSSRKETKGGGSSRNRANSSGSSFGSLTSLDEEEVIPQTNPMVHLSAAGQNMRRLDAHASVLL